MTAPRWAQELVITVCERYGKDDLPDLRWRHGDKNRTGSSGCCNNDTGIITITAAPGNRVDQKMTLLHEMAHWLRPNRDSHSNAFWTLAWELYRWAKLPIRYCQQQEYSYMKGAAVAYRRNRKSKS